MLIVSGSKPRSARNGGRVDVIAIQAEAGRPRDNSTTPSLSALHAAARPHRRDRWLPTPNFAAAAIGASNA